MRTLNLSLCWTTLAVAALTMAAIPADAEVPSWTSAEGLTFRIVSGMEVAMAGSEAVPAHLSLVCSTNHEAYLLLRTRLPGERWALEEGYDSSVSLFVSGDVQHEIKPAMSILHKSVRQSPSHGKSQNDDPAYLDTIVSTSLSGSVMDNLIAWLDYRPSQKVSIVGIQETGVFMQSASSGSDIEKFRQNCFKSD